MHRVLHLAAESGANEVFFEAGEPPRVRDPAGSRVLGDAWSERELFDALESLLSPEQLAELAVGNVVEFHVDVDAGCWTLLGQPTLQGVVVRGRFLPFERGAELGLPMVLPPLEPFVPGRAEPPTGRPVTQPSSRSERDRGLRSGLDDPLGWLIRNDEHRERSSAPPLSTGTSLRKATGESAIEGSELPELLDPGLDEDTSPRIRVEEITVHLGQNPAIDDNPTSVALRAVSGADPFLGHARVIAPGTLCIIQGEGVAEALARHLDEGVYTVIEGDDPHGVMRTARSARTFVVRLEDPSVCLGWILRRLEEGARVVVETHARSPEGARRILLGTTHGPQAADWLDAHPRIWVSWHDGTWVADVSNA